MNTSLHLNLLKDEERYSSSPVRLRVMVPVIALLAVAGLAVWWTLYVFRVHAVMMQKKTLEIQIADLTPAHTEILRLRAQEKECEANLRQLKYYCHSRLRFGELFTALTDHVPADIQLTGLWLLPPPPPPPPDLKTKIPLLGPTNLFETVTLRLAGRAGGENPTKAVDSLLRALNTQPVFTNLIRSAQIPKGAFRLDTGKGSASNRDTRLFEITCECVPRRFE